MSKKNKEIEEITEDAVESTEQTDDMKDSCDEESAADDDSEVDKLIEKAKKKEEKKQKKNKKKNKKDEKKKPEDVNIVKELLSLIIYIGIVVLICYFVIHFVGCRSKVDGSSMYPTLENGDNLWVDKISYRFGEPKRFDIVIFDYDEDTTFVKRIIGLPGETVRIDLMGNIYINDQILEEDYGYEVINPDNLGRASQNILLGDDEYFVLGDNRNNSRDSRWADVGNVKKEDIIGKAVLRIYPFSSFGKIE